jgi:hypothetical protein
MRISIRPNRHAAPPAKTLLQIIGWVAVWPMVTAQGATIAKAPIGTQVQLSRCIRSGATASPSPSTTRQRPSTRLVTARSALTVLKCTTQGEIARYAPASMIRPSVVTVRGPFRIRW